MKLSLSSLIAFVLVCCASVVVAQPQVVFAPRSIDFGWIFQGTIVDSVITISNPGDVAVHVTDVVSTDPSFTILNPNFPLTIEPKAQADLQLRFATMAYGFKMAMLSSISDAVKEDTISLMGMAGAIGKVKEKASLGDLRVCQRVTSAHDIVLDVNSRTAMRALISVFDARGVEVLQSRSVQIGEGESRLTIEASALPTGLYLCVLRSASGVMLVKLLL